MPRRLLINRSIYTMPLHLHGITPVRPDERYCFASPEAPAEFFLKHGLPHVRYWLASNQPEAGEHKSLLILAVEDNDPVGQATQLRGWHYAESYEIDWTIYHVWWHLAPTRHQA